MKTTLLKTALVLFTFVLCLAGSGTSIFASHHPIKKHGYSLESKRALIGNTYTVKNNLAARLM